MNPWDGVTGVLRARRLYHEPSADTGSGGWPPAGVQPLLPHQTTLSPEGEASFCMIWCRSSGNVCHVGDLEEVGVRSH